MKLAQVLGPLSLPEFREEYWGKRCLLLPPREGNALRGLVTVEELEVRLNDGCATMTNLAVIAPDGGKLPRDKLYHRQLGPSWTPEFLKKRELDAFLEAGSSFVMHNMTHINPRVAELIADIEAAFPDFAADVHLYVSPKAAATGYRAHRDQPQHKIYLQVFGTTAWTIYRGSHPKIALDEDETRKHLAVDLEARLVPGSVLYMPPGVFHRATNPDGPRLSVSIPIAPRLGVVPVDRHHVSLVQRMGDSTILS